MKYVRLSALLLLNLLLGGCIQYTLVPAGEVTVNTIKTQTSLDWNKSPFKLGPSTTVWTADGELLNQVIFVHGVKDGGTLFNSTSKDVVMPKFSNNILPHEIEDLIITSLTNLYSGQITIETSNLKPVKFGEASGIEFELHYYSVGGLSTKGKVKATISDGTLFAIIFTAADLHYFDKYQSEVNALFEAARIES